MKNDPGRIRFSFVLYWNRQIGKRKQRKYFYGIQIKYCKYSSSCIRLFFIIYRYFDNSVIKVSLAKVNKKLNEEPRERRHKIKVNDEPNREDWFFRRTNQDDSGTNER